MNTIDYEGIKKVLKKRLKDKRYEHSLGVMETMCELAEIYHADKEKAKLAGLVHDITKNDTLDEQLACIERYDIPADEDIKTHKKLLHAVTAPYVLKNELGIDDEDVLRAVRYHTTARPDMDLLEKLLYVADYIDPTRDYDDVDFYRELARKDIDRCAFLCLAYTVENLSKNKKFIYKDTFEAYSFYAKIYEKQEKDKIYE